MSLATLSLLDVSILLAVAFLVGMAKAGINGTTLFYVPLLALLFGGRQSTGLLLPILIMADFFAVRHYHQHANWHYLLKLFPSAALGVVLGTWLGDHIDDQRFMQIMALIVFASVALMLWLEKNKRLIPDYTWFALLMGTLGGFTTMVGNLAGTVMAVYFLSMRLPKNVFIGTAAWFFLVINWFKVPFHIWVWETITWDTLLISALGLPMVILGVYVGIWVVSKISDIHYRRFIIAMTLVAATGLLLR